MKLEVTLDVAVSDENLQEDLRRLTQDIAVVAHVEGKDSNGWPTVRFEALTYPDLFKLLGRYCSLDRGPVASDWEQLEWILDTQVKEDGR